jgi:hypothetical protein
VSAKLIKQFADCLATTVLAGGDQAGDGRFGESGSGREGTTGSEPGGNGARTANRARPTSDTVDLADVAGGAVAKRVIPALIALAVLILIWRAVRRAGS